MASQWPSQGISEWLKWNDGLGLLKLNSSALRCFSEAAPNSWRNDFLRGANRTLITHVQGLTLVTLIHRDLLHHLRADVYGASLNMKDGEDFYPILCSSVAFDGDTMHQLNRNFVRGQEHEFRELILLVHFFVLNGIIEALPRGLTQSIRNFAKGARYFRWGSWSMSSATAVSTIWPSWHPSLLLQCPGFLTLIGLLLGCMAPFLLRRVLDMCLKRKLDNLRKLWQEDHVSHPGA
jgi:hypothetical protein